MPFWKVFWSAFLFLGLSAFVLLVLYVALGGLSDVRALLGAMRRDEET